LLHAGGLVAPFAQVEVFGVHVPETMEKPEAQVLQDGGFVAPFVQGVGVLLLHVGGFVAPLVQGVTFVFGVHVPETMEKPEAQVLQDGGFVAPFVQGVVFVLGTQTPFTLEDPEAQGVGVLLLHVGGFVAPLVQGVGVGSVTTKLAAVLELQFPKQLLKLYKLSAPTLLTSPVCADTFTPNVPGFKDSGFLILKNKFLSVPPPNPRVPLFEELDTALNPLPDQVTLLAPLPLNNARMFRAAFLSPPSNLNFTL
jgi:hypothetical protein